ncbi:MAG: winged helix-turn-helix transcriptional regulator [Ilumatobacteraceae bacterium]
MSVTAYADPSGVTAQDVRDVRRASRSDLDLIEHVDRTLETLQGKWKIYLLFFMARGIRRHSRLLDCLPGASKKIMTETLRALERDGLVERAVFAEVPVRVEYSLTHLGWTITEPLVLLAEWGEAHASEVVEARARWRLVAHAGHHRRPDSGRSLAASSEKDG